MRVLSFVAEGQKLMKDSKCDFSGIVPNSKGYLCAKFTLKKGWENCRIAAQFWRLGKEFPVLLNQDGICNIPDEALTWNNFWVSLTGVRGDYKITTNKVLVEQEG